MTPLTKFWATISQEIEPEISCGLLEKVACQFLSIDKPLFRQSRVRRNSVPPDLLKGPWGPMKSPGENPGLFMGAADADVKSILETLEKETGAVLR